MQSLHFKKDGWCISRSFHCTKWSQNILDNNPAHLVTFWDVLIDWLTNLHILDPEIQWRHLKNLPSWHSSLSCSPVVKLSACWKTSLWSQGGPPAWWPGRLLSTWQSGLWITRRPSLAGVQRTVEEFQEWQEFWHASSWLSSVTKILPCAGPFWSWEAVWDWPASPSAAPAARGDTSSVTATPESCRDWPTTSGWTVCRTGRLLRSVWRTWTGRRWERSS